MEQNAFFSAQEKVRLAQLYRELLKLSGNILYPDDCKKLKTYLLEAARRNLIQRNVFGMNPILNDMETALIVASEIGLTRGAILGIMVHTCVRCGYCTPEDVEREFGVDVAGIIKGLNRILELYEKNPSVESENFRSLLLSFAEDMRVVLIMIANRVNIMRKIKDTENEEARRKVSEEAAYLYAPLAHKLGLYRLKSELEDLSLKYLEHDAYYLIKEKLNATKKSRDEYIEKFIRPIDEKLKKAGLKFHMKGRTKSIHSIWQKMKKQHCGVEGIYDLFAIRIILDSALEKEKMECWQVYSIITDMYQPNPKRLRDWLSIPKSNGYESLHITVLGPENKWVEVQIRTERMDEIAERGLAAHWRYKGIKGGESGVDEWLNNIRSALENNDDLQLMDQFKMDLYEDVHPEGGPVQVSQRCHCTGFCLYHPHQCGRPLYRCQNQRKECPTPPKTEQRRPSGNPDRQQPVAQTGLAEFRRNRKGTGQNPSGSQRNASQARGFCQRVIGTQIQKPEDRIRRADHDARHQKARIQSRDGLL